MRRFRPHALWLGIALSSAGLATASVILTHWQHLHPCHLCIFQRFLMMCLAMFALLAMSASRLRLVAGLLALLTSAGGIATAAHQVWLQAHADPMACGGSEAPDLIQHFVAWLTPISRTLFLADGLCSDKQLEIFGVALAGWSLVAFSVFLLAGIWAIAGDRRS